MDIGSILGVILVVFALTFAVVGGGGAGADAFLDLPSIACVFGGTLATVLMSYPLKTVLNLRKVCRAAFSRRPADVRATITTLVTLAEIARRDGLLALESRVAEFDHPFIVSGVQLAVDGNRPEIIEEVLRAQMESTAHRHGLGKGMIDAFGKYAPAYGMIGTLLGLVIMLGNMSNPDSIGPGMAVALLTTLYGALLANAVCLPLADKLGFLNKQELIEMEIVLKGILAIQSGDNPRLIEQRLSMYLPPGERDLGRKPRMQLLDEELITAP